MGLNHPSSIASQEIRADQIRAGTVLIKESSLLPESLRLETDSDVTGGRFFKHLGGTRAQSEDS
jgi:hypothetical protein